jgi:hypothetical protein
MSSWLYQLHPHEIRSIDAFLEPGTHVGYLGNPDWNRSWSILHEEPGRILLEHWNHALAWVEVEDEKVVSHQIIVGDEAREERAKYVDEED